MRTAVRQKPAFLTFPVYVFIYTICMTMNVISDLTVQINLIQLLTTDLLALASMKNAAKCEKECELQNSVNHRIFEHTFRSLIIRRACLFEYHEILNLFGFF